jgi:hypothetical protein
MWTVQFLRDFVNVTIFLFILMMITGQPKKQQVFCWSIVIIAALIALAMS